MKLVEISKGSNNNLNIIRLLAAYMVIFGHSFSLTDSGLDYVKRVSGEQTSFGDLAVSIFFFLGGFLVLKSANNKQAFKPYFKARCKRIFPELWLVVLFSVFIVGPLFTNMPIVEYFTDLKTYKYLLNGIFVLIHNLPGVFLNNKYNPTVNGALWTLPVEFMCYFACYVFYKLFYLKKKSIVFTVPLVLCIYIGVLLLNNTSLVFIIRPVVFFYVGMLFYTYRESITINIGLFVASIGLTALSMILGGYSIISLVCFSYIITYLGFGTKHKISFSFFGLDITYGIYLTGFVVQQCLCSLIPDISQFCNFIYALILATALAMVLSVADKKLTGMVFK